MADKLAARNAATAVAGRPGKSSRQDQAAELPSSCYGDICKNYNAETCQIFKNTKAYSNVETFENVEIY